MIRLGGDYCDEHCMLFRVEEGGAADRPFLYVSRFPIVKRTAKGFWVRGNNGDRKFVRDGDAKRFAYPTVAEALRGYQARKKKQLEILERHRAFSEAALGVALKLDPASLQEGRCWPWHS